MPDIDFGKDYELWAHLHLTTTAIARAREKELGRSIIYAAVLTLVKYAEGQATASKLSRWLFRERNTMSDLIHRMQRKGLLELTRDPIRKNRIRISLTELGEKAYHESVEGRWVIEDIMSCLTQEECETLWACLSKLQNSAIRHLGIKHRLIFPSDT